MGGQGSGEKMTNSEWWLPSPSAHWPFCPIADQGPALLQNLKSAGANTVGIALTSEIGEAYAKGQIGFATHKGLHTATGALEGFVLNGADGALAGGIGAFTSETIADLLAPEMPSLDNIKTLEAQIGRPLTKEEFIQNWNDQIETYWQNVSTTADISKLAAVSITLLANLDVDTAQITASNAIDNNFFILAGYGLIGAGAVYSGYQIYNEYQTGGPEAALKQLGVEILIYGGGIAASKVVFKVGSIMYPTAKAAVNAALEATPGLKLALNKIIDPMVVAGEKFGQSKLGKGIANIENSLVNAENTVKQTFRGANLAEDLVERAVPSNVISKMKTQTGKQAVVSSAPSVKIKDISAIESEIQSILKDSEGRVFLEIKHPVLDNIRTGSAFIKPDPHHAFDPIVDNFARYAKKFNLQGRDEIWKELYQIEGSLNGKNGIFEWIVDPRADRGLTHRFFVKNGTITGKPNIYSGKKNV